MALLVLVLAGLAVIVIIGFLAVGRLGQLDDAEHDRAPYMPPVAPITAASISEVRFDIAVRGYRMADVDDCLNELTAAIADKDAQIAALRQQVEMYAPRTSPIPAVPAAGPTGAVAPPPARSFSDELAAAHAAQSAQSADSQKAGPQ